MVPLPRMARLLGVPLGSSDAIPDPSGALPLTAAELRRLRVLGRIGPRWPFCEGPCLRQALVAGHILRRHHPRLRIGASLKGSALVAHAWVELDGGTVGADDSYTALVHNGGAVPHGEAAAPGPGGRPI